MKNFLINSSMQISQERGASVLNVTSDPVTVNFRDTLDCFMSDDRGTFEYSVQQVINSDVDGFPFWLRFECVTGDATLASGDVLSVMQVIEGERIARLAFGTPSAQGVTFSFIVMSNVPGLAGGALKNVDANDHRVYVFSYEIDSANTPEIKNISIPGDTGAPWKSDNSSAMQALLNVASGSALQVTPDAWQAQTAASATGSVNRMSAQGDYFQIAGAVLTPGQNAFDIDQLRTLMRTRSEDLALCRRYYWKGKPALRGAVSWPTEVNRLGLQLPVPMCKAPDVRIGGSLPIYDGVAIGTLDALTSNFSSNEVIEVGATLSIGTLGQGRSCVVYQDGNPANFVEFDARLRL